jgi:hypothetical protein
MLVIIYYDFHGLKVSTGESNGGQREEEDGKIKLTFLFYTISFSINRAGS